MCVLVAQLCPTLCNPKDCSLPGSSVHGILQARILEWLAIHFSRGFSRPRDWTLVFCIAGRFFTIWATGIGGKLSLYWINLICNLNYSQKKFRVQIASLMKSIRYLKGENYQVYTNFFRKWKREIFHNSLYEVNIVSLSKFNKSIAEKENYRPISLKT